MDRVARVQGNHATRIEAVRSTHAKAVGSTMNDGVPDDSPVWVIQAEGYLSCGTCSVPLGATTPHGGVLTLVVGDPAIGTTLDLGLTATPRDLSQLGPIVRLRG